MDGIHDMGGMHGFGAIDHDPRPFRFSAEWEGKTFALVSLMMGAGLCNVDRFRHAIERVPVVDYLANGYYGRWLAGLEILLDEANISPTAEPRQLTPPTERSVRREVDQTPRFATGDLVRTHNRQPSGHTRLPRYARDQVGTILQVHPAYVFPDTNAHDQGENPQYVYSIGFDGKQLWGPDAEEGVTVSLDLFESYLLPAASQTSLEAEGVSP